MGRRGKKVTEHKKNNVLELLKKHSPRMVARETKLSLSEVYKIRRESERKSQTLHTITEKFEKTYEDLKQLIPETLPAEQFLRLYGDKMDPLTKRIIEDCKPRCRLAVGPASEDFIVIFEKMGPEAYKDWLAQTRKKLEEIRRLAVKLPRPPLPRPSPDMFWDMNNHKWVNIEEYAKQNGYRVVEENGKKYIDASSIIDTYIKSDISGEL